MIVATLRDRNERISRDLQLPGDTPIGQLVPQLVNTMGLPARDQQGASLPYALILRDNGYILPDDQTLISLGIASGRILLLVVPTPDERLRSAKARGVSPVQAPAQLPSTIGVPGQGGEAPPAGVTFNRPPRILVHLPTEEIELPKPPTQNREGRKLDWIALLTPLIILGVLAFLILVIVPRFFPNNSFSPVFLIFMGVYSIFNPIGQLLSIALERRHESKALVAKEEDYRQLLAKTRTKLEALRVEQHRARRASSPSVRKLRGIIDERSHLWERRPEDADFLHLRMGKTTLPSTVKVTPPSLNESSALQDEAEALAKEFEYVPDVPISLPLPQLGSIGVTGARGPVVDFARALVCHLAVHHSPDEVRIIGIYPYEQSREWEWLKWMPHTNHFKPGSQNKMLAFTPDQIEELLDDVTEEISRREARKEEEKDGAGDGEPMLPYLVLLVDDYNRVRDHVGLSEVLRNGRGLNISAMILVDSRQDIPGDCGAILEVPSYEQMVYSVAGPEGSVKDQIAPDRVDRGTGEAIARSLAPIRVSGSQGPGNIKTSVRLLDLLNLEAADQLDPRTWWGEQPRFGRLTVPIGEKSGGPLLLDLTDAAHGPHGLVAGTTGSGKSELLQTLIAGLAVTHHPHLLNFVLVDFKGGSAFKDFENIPHTVGMVSDLHGRLAERALIALKSELKRREHILHEANAVNIAQYQAMRARDPKALQPMPSLLIVIDEFAELAKELPDFMGGLISVVQKGRSLGVHLILATQRPAGVVSANIWSNVKFRICLRVASIDDSREMLGRSDAALLPHNLPGRGFFQVGAEIFDQFQVARVAGAYRPAAPQDAKKQAEIAELTRAGHIHNIGSGKQARVGAGVVTDDRSELQVMMTQMEPFKESLGAALFRPWPDPLPGDLTLPDMFKQAGKPGLDGARWEAKPAFGWLNTPIGLLDLPAEQRQEIFMLDLLRYGGHMLISGSAGSGKSFLLRTIVASLAQSHSPADLNLYLIDFGGQAMRVFEKMPHVGGVFNSADSERIRRLFRKLRGIIEERKLFFREQRVDSFLAYQTRAAASSQQQKPLPAIVVVIDKFAEFRAVHEKELDDLMVFAREGRGYGIHLIIAADRPNSLPGNLAGNIELRYGLRLADPGDSILLLGKSDAATLDPNMPGRGLRRGRRLEEFQTALPVVGDGDEEQAQQLEALAARAAQAWKGAPAESIGLLPEYVSLPDLLTQASMNGQTAKTEGLRAPLGLDDLNLRPIWGELTPDTQHFLIAGSAGSGKTSIIRTWLLGLAQRYTPADVQIVLVDLRRTSRGLRTLPHMRGYAENEMKLTEILDGLKKELTERIQRLNAGGSAAKTPMTPIVLAIDDFELVAALPKNPGTELRDLIRQARDLNLHIIMAGTTADVVKAFDPLAAQVKAVRAGIVLSGDPQETGILGVRLTDLPTGRGTFVQRNSRNLMQAGFLEPEAVPVWMAQIRGGGVSIKG